MATIPRIRLSEENQLSLVRRLREMIDAATEMHNTWEDLHEIYMKQYLCQTGTEVKNYPWRNASNLFLPLGRVIQDGIMAQLHEAMFTNDPVVRVRAGANSQTMGGADLLSLFYGSYVYKKVIPMTRLGNDWNFNLCLDGTSMIRPRWMRNQYLRRTLMPEIKPIYGEAPMTEELMGVTVNGARPVVGYSEDIREDVTVERESKPVVDILHMNRVYFAPDSVNSITYPDCSWYYVVHDMTWDQLCARRNEGYDNVDDELKSTVGQRDIDRIEQASRRNEGLSESRVLDTIPVYEFHMRLTLPAEYNYEDVDGKQKKRKQDFDDENGFQEEVVLTFLPTRDKIARIVPLWRLRPDGKRLDIINHYNRIPHRVYGQGIQAKMRHLNAMMNTLGNQGIDYGTLQNLPFFFYTPHMTGLMPDINQIMPGQGVPVNDSRGINFPRMNGDSNFWLNMMYTCQQWGERDGQINDQNTGRMPERSANKTFRGMAMVQQLQNIMFRRFASLISQPYIDLFEAVHELYKRNAPDEMVFKVTGDDGYKFSEHRITRDMLKEDVEFDFVLNPDRQGEQQIAQTLFQLVMQIPWIAQNPMSVRAAAKQLYDSIGYGSGRRNFEEIWPEAMTQQIVMQQRNQMLAQQGQQPQPMPQPGMPQPGMQQSAPQLPPAQLPPIERNEMSDEDMGVALAST